MAEVADFKSLLGEGLLLPSTILGHDSRLGLTRLISSIGSGTRESGKLIAPFLRRTKRLFATMLKLALLYIVVTPLLNFTSHLASERIDFTYISNKPAIIRLYDLLNLHVYFKAS